MSLIKSICWNIHNKSSYISCKTFSNLNGKQCKKSYLLFLYCNIHTMEKANNISTQLKRISKSKNADEPKMKMDNNKLISTTAIEVSSADNWRVGSDRSGSLPNNICRSRRFALATGRSGQGSSGTNKESTSNIKSAITNRNSQLCKNPAVVTMDCSSQFAQNSFFAYPSSYYPYNYVPFVNNPGLAQYNVAPIPQKIEQRSYSNFVGHSLRKVYLFRDEKNGQIQQDGGGSQRHSSTNSDITNKELRDKEIVRTLRAWMPSQISTSATKRNSSLEFTLMSYNVLAQDLLTGHEYLYRNHSPNALLWKNRWANLFEEIVTHNADIICLQEVQESHIEKYFSQLNNLGYANVYKRKTGNKTDGCAIYYRKAMFKMIENTTVEYNQGYSVLDRDNVGIIVKLAPVKHPKVEFVVATTHLLYNPRRQDVRLAQTQVLLAEVDRIAYKSGTLNKYVPIIITGDFNSEPESAVYKLIVEGTLRYSNLTSRTLVPTNSNFDLAGKILIPNTLRITDNCQHLDLLKSRALNITLSRGEELKLIQLRHSKRPKTSSTDTEINGALFSTGILSHELKLQSAFIHTVGNDTVGTTNQDGWITVDYIFYSGEYSNRKQQLVDGKLKLLSRYSIPTTQQLMNVQNIPNFALGSDHLALLSKFRLDF